MPPQIHRIIRPLVPGLAVLSLAACGGGGSGSINPTDPVPSDLTTITSENASEISSAVVKAAFEGGELASFADISGGVDTQVTLKGANTFAKVGQVQLEWTKPMLVDSQIGILQVPIDPIETACEIGGSVTISGDLANAETLTANDTITMVFDACDDGLTEADGTLAMTILSFSGDAVSGNFAFEVSVTLTEFTVTQGSDMSTANGTITVGMDIPLSGAISFTIASNDFSISDGTETESLEDFSISQTIDPVTGVYTLTASGTITSSGFTGSVEFMTTATLEWFGTESAHAGRIVITGDANATITIDVLDSQFVRLSIDLDGDEIVDETVDISWAELI